MMVSKILAKGWLFLCVLLVLVPITVIIASVQEFDAEIWAFLLDYQLPILLKNTAILALSVAVGVVVLGVSTAWLTTMYRFPAQKWLAFAMMLPMAMPAYVLAFTWVGLFAYSGAIGEGLRQLGLPAIDIRNGAGLSVVMSLAFYPYVYLLAKSAFATMGGRAMEAGASLGLSPYQAFFKIALPMARPFIVGGLWLCMMEVLADFGTVSVFGYETFTTAIYEAWFGFFSLETAKQLALILISFVLILVVLEQASRGKRQFYEAGKASRYEPVALVGIKKYLASGYCLLIMTLAFFVPLGQLIVWVASSVDSVRWGELLGQTLRSLLMSTLSGLLVGVVALGLVLAKQTLKTRWATLGLKIATLGYAIPGTVLAVGIFVPIAWLDNWLIGTFSLSATAIFKGTLFVMLLAYLVRFLALGVQAVGAGADRIQAGYMESAYTLGKTPIQAVREVYVPMIKGSLWVAMLMTFVDVMKEIPITLMMRPTGFDMLSARIYAFTTEGLYDKAAFPALIVVLVGLLPVIGFAKIGKK